MLKKAAYLVIGIVFIFQNAFSQEICPIIPLPNHYEKAAGTFSLNNHTSLIVKDPSFAHAAYFLKNQLLRYTGIPLSFKGDSTNVIILKKNNTLNNKQGSYAIDMQHNKIILTAKDDKGMFNGVVSILQLALHTQKKRNDILLTCWNIQDAPLYTWRGFMLDESRHFFGKKVVKEILDQMALLKLNRFHWHLTDEPGWRIQIKKYPRLANVGGIGNKTDSTAPAKYYTQQDIREIVDYAKARNIQIIPEIDMPGHATAANRAYPQFSGGGTGKYANFTFNPGKSGTFQYLTNILKEVAVLFPSGIIHLGGDEVSFGSKSWNKDKEVQALMQTQHLENLRAVEHYFFRRMTDSALQYFDRVAAWDEAVDAGTSPDNTIIFWWRHNKPQQLSKALHAGYHVVLCPRIPLYFDFVQDSSNRVGRRWAGKFASLKQVYQFSNSTYPEAEINPGLILGIQANLWTETVRTKRRLEFLSFPRMDALAEAAWTQPAHRNYSNFLKRLQLQFLLFKKENIYYFNPTTPQKTPEVIY